jgi:hypothetical protein
MEKLFSLEQWRIVTVSAVSPILGYLTPTKGFVCALVIMFAFNLWSGMRADGVTIVRCKNFSFSKFKNALFELVLYLVIIELVFSIMVSCGDSSAALVAIKSLTYVFIYVYLQNAFRNLIIAYPEKTALHVIYHVIRFEFTRAMPSNIQKIINRYEREKDAKKDNSTT